MTPDQWDALGWHQQRALIEGLEDEGVIERNGAEAPQDLTSASDADFTEMGIRVESIG